MSVRPITAVFANNTRKAPKRHSNAFLTVERRAESRLPVLDGSLPGVLRLASTHHELVAGAINVSARGLSIWVEEALMPGGDLTLLLPGGFGEIALVVTHCRPQEDVPGRWIVGLKINARRVENLAEVFVKFGCVNEDDD